MQGESRRRKRAGLGPWGKQGVQKRQTSRLNPAPGPRSLATHPQGPPGPPRALWPHTRSQSQLPGACPWAWPGARVSPPPGAHCWSGRGIRHWSPGSQSLRGDRITSIDTFPSSYGQQGHCCYTRPGSYLPETIAFHTFPSHLCSDAARMF